MKKIITQIIEITAGDIADGHFLFESIGKSEELDHVKFFIKDLDSDSPSRARDTRLGLIDDELPMLQYITRNDEVIYDTRETLIDGVINPVEP